MNRDVQQGGRYRILFAGFFGWMLAGVQLGISSIVMRPATQDLLQSTNEGDIGKWFGWLTAAFLLGGAAGGYLFGSLGDRIGRKKATAAAIATYSIFAGLTYFVGAPWQLLAMRFAIGLGVGGMWPNGIALVSEAWPGMSRPMIAGVLGTAANIGIMTISAVSWYYEVTHDDWRWMMQLTAYPVILAILVLLFVPESVRWLAAVESHEATDRPKRSPQVEVFQRPILATTLLGIVLGTIPLFGGWGSANWANAWASQVGDKQVETVDESEQASPAAESGTSPTEDADREEESTAINVDARLKARAMLARSGPGSLASLLGGALATWFGRRRFYFFLCFACLASSQYLFLYSQPGRPDFLWAMAALGLFSGFFFGWLPLCLPELFPTHIRATGAGVSFNFGRIATAIGILVAAGLLKSYFDGNYAQIGRFTSWIYAIGAVAILFAPDMGKKGIEDLDP